MFSDQEIKTELVKQKDNSSRSNGDFCFFEKMPPEIMPTITRFQSLRKRLTVDPLPSKYFNETSKDPLSWNYTGATDYRDFVQRMQALPKKYQCLILSETKPYSLIFAENLIRILAMPKEERIRQLITPEQAASIPAPILHHLIVWEHGVTALREGLITPEQAAAIPMDGFDSPLDPLLTDNGIIALREGLITPEQVAETRFWVMFHLLSDNGLNALRLELITSEEAVAFNSSDEYARDLEIEINNRIANNGSSPTP